MRLKAGGRKKERGLILEIGDWRLILESGDLRVERNPALRRSSLVAR